jgi:hypothetical protein
VKKIKTIHTSRTIMFAELEKVMAFSFENGNYKESLTQNITGKKSNSGVIKTSNYLRQLYGFDINYPLFKAFTFLWNLCDESEKPLITFLYAINHDDLLAESLEVLQRVNLGDKAKIEYFEEVIEKFHPNQYSANTLRSLAQNIASSWKQAGFIEGKVRNIRTMPEVTFRVACFAFLMAYLKGDRGEFIWNSLSVNALFLSEKKLRELAVESSKRDLMQYQYAGSVTIINFSDLLTKMEIHGNEN